MFKTATEAQRGPYKKVALTAVKRIRIQRGLTQVQAAALCSVPLRTYQRVEAGDCRERTTVRSVERSFGLFL